jgi:hypothetical protein
MLSRGAATRAPMMKAHHHPPRRALVEKAISVTKPAHSAALAPVAKAALAEDLAAKAAALAGYDRAACRVAAECRCPAARCVAAVEAVQAGWALAEDTDIADLA